MYVYLREKERRKRGREERERESIPRCNKIWYRCICMDRGISKKRENKEREKERDEVIHACEEIDR